MLAGDLKFILIPESTMENLSPQLCFFENQSPPPHQHVSFSLYKTEIHRDTHNLPINAMLVQCLIKNPNSGQ